MKLKLLLAATLVLSTGVGVVNAKGVRGGTVNLPATSPTAAPASSTAAPATVADQPAKPVLAQSASAAEPEAVLIPQLETKAGKPLSDNQREQVRAALAHFQDELVRATGLTRRDVDAALGGWVLPVAPSVRQPIIMSGQWQTKVNPIDGAIMVLIPAGNFTLGNARGDYDEKPQHQIYLDGYWMYRDLVTVAQYRQFCTASHRDMPQAPSWGWHEDHPIVNVSWNDAVAYCKWAGTRLPTEAEWEKAARGVDGRPYPWGNEFDAARLSNSVLTDAGGTAPVSSYANGASPYGLLDMAGNVWQWCADLYDPNYYTTQPDRNPPGPKNGERRVLRGGSWFNKDRNFFRSSFRNRSAPSLGNNNGGFRCAAAQVPAP